MLYRLTRIFVKIAMRVFFQRIELRNGGQVPDDGPVLFVANHPNSIMDALVIGVVTKRKVNYVARSGLFSNKFNDWFLRSTGVIPVYRKMDSPDQMSQNVLTFESCYQALERGEAIGIFPEGSSDMARKVKRIKTGAARIVLEAEKRNNYSLGITLLPIGLYFFSRSRFRGRVLVNVGQPIRLRRFFERNEQNNVEAVQELTKKIQRSLEKITINIRHEELDEFVRDIEILYREDLKSELQGIAAASKKTVQEFFLTQRIAECVNYYFERDPERISFVRELINNYKRKLRHLRLKDTMVKEKATFTSLLKRSPLSFGKTLLGLPLAFYGTINNCAPYWLTEIIAKKLVSERTQILSALLIGGSLLFLLFYGLQIGSVWYMWGNMLAGIYLVSLPFTGFFALWYLRHVRAEVQRLNLTFFLLTNKQLYNKMRRERRRLVEELDRIRDEYLAISRPGETRNLVGR